MAGRPPKIPPELWAAADELIKKLSRSPFGSLSPEVLGESAAPLPAAVGDAALAMKRVFTNVLKDFQPEVIAPLKGTPRPTDVKYIQGKAGALLPSERAINEQDLANELITRVLDKGEKFPQNTAENLIGRVEPRLYGWTSRVTETIPTPHGTAAARRLVQNAGKIRPRFVGRSEDDPEVIKAREWLESRGLFRPPRRSFDQEIRSGGSEGEGYTTLGDMVSDPLANPTQMAPQTPAEALAAREAVNEPSPQEQLLTKLQDFLQDPKGLTEKQRATLGFRFGLDQPKTPKGAMQRPVRRPGSEPELAPLRTTQDIASPVLSASEEAKLLGQDLKTVKEREEFALNKIRKALGLRTSGTLVTPTRPEVQGPPLPILPSAKRVFRFPNPEVQGPRSGETREAAIREYLPGVPPTFATPVQGAPGLGFQPPPADIPAGSFTRITIMPEKSYGGLPITVRAQGPPRLVTDNTPTGPYEQFPLGEGPPQLLPGYRVQPREVFPQAPGRLMPRGTIPKWIFPGELVKGRVYRQRELQDMKLDELLTEAKKIVKPQGADLVEKAKNLRAVRDAQFKNTPGWRLIKDPEGSIVINGERYTRVPAVGSVNVDPKTKRRKKGPVVVDLSRLETL